MNAPTHIDSMHWSASESEMASLNSTRVETDPGNDFKTNANHPIGWRTSASALQRRAVLLTLPLILIPCTGAL